MKYKDEVFKIIKSQTSKNFDEETNIRDLGLDSLDLVELIVEFEEKIGIDIPNNKITNIKTIKDILNLLDELS